MQDCRVYLFGEIIGRVIKHSKNDGMDTRDYITNLPDDIISNILSRLETKYAVQTCVLSKAWENKWMRVYNIAIHRYSRSGWLPFSSFVDRVLFNVQDVRRFHFRSHYPSVYGNSFVDRPFNAHINYPEEYENSRMETWLYNLFRRNVQEVDVATQHKITLPGSLSTCTSLKELDMVMPCTWKTPVHSCFPNLTRLSLSQVRIKNENSNSDTLVFHFPVLNILELRWLTWLNVRFAEFYAPALITFLSKTDIVAEIDSFMIKIIGSSLQNIKTGGRHLDNFILDGSTVSYAALKNEDSFYHIDEDTDEEYDTILKSGLRVRRLLIESSSLKSLRLTHHLAQALAVTKSGLPLSSFPNLETLALCSGDGVCTGSSIVIGEIFEGLCELLHSAPVLKSLIIEGISSVYLRELNDYDSDMMELVPSCVVSHLEEVEIKYYSGDIQELHLAKYFVENGAQLKKLSLWCNPCIGKDEVRNQLAKCRKASTSLEISSEQVE